MANDYTIKVFTLRENSAGKRAAFEIFVDTEKQAHAQQIIREGYRRKVNDTTYEWISPNIIASVRIIGSSFSLGYNDTDITS